MEGSKGLPEYLAVSCNEVLAFITAYKNDRKTKSNLRERWKFLSISSLSPSIFGNEFLPPPTGDKRRIAAESPFHPPPLANLLLSPHPMMLSSSELPTRKSVNWHKLVEDWKWKNSRVVRPFQKNDLAHLIGKTETGHSVVGSFLLCV